MPLSFRIDLGSHQLNITEWQPKLGANDSTVLLLHATGFHGRIWDEVVALLPDQHVIAWDMRGHGHSDRCESYSWHEIRNDLINLLTKLELKQLIVAGHSIGGWCALATAAMQPDTFSNILLIDPVITAPEIHTSQTRFAGLTAKTHPVTKRRNNWTSWEQMRDHFKPRKPFASWTAACLEDYCRYGLVDNPDAEGLMLACHPEVEAGIYTSYARGFIEDDLDRIESYVRILRAPPIITEPDMMDFSGSPTWPELAAHLPNADDVLMPNLSHLMLMEDPSLIATHIRSLLDRVN